MNDYLELDTPTHLGYHDPDSKNTLLISLSAVDDIFPESIEAIKRNLREMLLEFRLNGISHLTLVADPR